MNRWLKVIFFCLALYILFIVVPVLPGLFVMK